MIPREHDRAFFLCRAGDGAITCATGTVTLLRRLSDIPLRSGTAQTPVVDVVCAVPFSQIRERGFDVVDEGEPILCLEVEEATQISASELDRAAGSRHISMVDAGGFDWDDRHYEGVIAQIIGNEIERGAGSNFVVPREFRQSIAGFDRDVALSMFRNLLEREYGAYWTFLLHAHGTFLVGASPERLISSANGTVMMNPISGTLRKMGIPHDQTGAALEAFLADEKEIYELFMVVDEELKMMAEICPHGGRITGPYLKEMSQLIHTEYLLAGRSSLSLIDQFRGSMFAATVVGSPIQNACRVVRRYRERSRRYYGSAVVTFGRDAAGPTMDSAITIRTAEIDGGGTLSVQVGATLVRNSTPKDEVLETHAKIAGLLRAIGAAQSPVERTPYLDLLAGDAVQRQLSVRNERLSRFWFVPQNDASPLRRSSRSTITIAIIDFEDNFTSMLGHILSSIGAQVSIISWDRCAVQELETDLVILGPGPGDPADSSDPRIASAQGAARFLLGSGKPFMAVCLGHQVLCRALGMELFRKARATQGTQETIDLFGQQERVGFYNTFAARAGSRRDDLEVCSMPDGEVFAIRGPKFASLQFHAESILTEHGPEILSRIVTTLLPQGNVMASAGDGSPEIVSEVGS